MRNSPRLLDTRRTSLDPEITVEGAFESFDSEESNALEFSPGLAPVVAARPTGNASSVAAEPPVVPTRLVAASEPAPALSESMPAVATARDWATVDWSDAGAFEGERATSCIGGLGSGERRVDVNR